MTIRNSLDIFTKTLNIYFASLCKQNTIKVQTGHFLSLRSLSFKILSEQICEEKGFLLKFVEKSFQSDF